jgi:Recombinase
LIETVEMPWGAKLIPVDELERLIAERRRPARARETPSQRGRPLVLSPDVVDHIRAEREAGRSLRQIATDLNERRVPTAHGGRQWWPSSVRAVLRRSSPASPLAT